MNAIKVTPTLARARNSEHLDVKLRVLSALQRKQVSVITDDWRRFTYQVGNGIYDKI